MKTRLFLSALVLLCAATISAGKLAKGVHAEGVGVWPSVIRFDNALRGGEYEAELNVSSQGDKVGTFNFERAGQAGQWVTLTASDGNRTEQNIQIPGAISMTVHLTVPKDLANGTYRGTIKAVADVKDTKLNLGSGATGNVALAAEASLVVTVTGTQNIAGKLGSLQTYDSEVGLPMKFTANVSNEGNVAMKPELTMKLTAVEAPVTRGVVSGKDSGAKTVASKETVYPGQGTTLTWEFPTDDLLPGNYVAQVSAAFGGKSFGEERANIDLKPRGTLARSGELVSMRFLTEPKKGAPVKVGVVFRNTGAVDSKAVFVGDLYRGNTLVSNSTGTQVTVPRGADATLEVYFPIPTDSGTYTIRGKVNFEGKESAMSELTFQFGGGGLLHDKLPILLIANGLFFSALTVFNYRRSKSPIGRRITGVTA